MCLRIVHIYACGHVDSDDFVYCAKSRTTGQACDSEDIRTKQVKHETKCDDCNG